MTTRSQTLADQKTPERQHSGDQRFTPGPWKIESDANQYGECRIVTADDDPWTIAEIAGGCRHHELGGEMESGANARLIAAAPDMLVALKLLVELRKPGTTLDQRFEIAQAAIARATGAQP